MKYRIYMGWMSDGEYYHVMCLVKLPSDAFLLSTVTKLKHQYRFSYPLLF